MRIFKSVKVFIKAHKIISAVITIIAVFAIIKIAFPAVNQIQFLEVKRGTITQEVEVTGRVKPVQNFSLAFQVSGRVASVKHDVSERVVSGEPIVVLAQNDLLAQLAQARANAEAEQAGLASLLAGTRPEALHIKQTAVAQAEQDLKNSYDNILSVLEGAYLTSNDAIRKQMSDLFIQAESISPQLSFVTSDQQAQIDATAKRYNAGLELIVWRKELDALYSATTTNADLTSGLASGSTHLGVLRDFLSRANDALNKALSLSSAAISTYKSELTTAGTQIVTAITNIAGASQTIRTKNLALQSAQNDLALSQAGSAENDINAQKAKLDSALANVKNIEAQLEKTIIRAPINGIVTLQDAKVGQIVGANTPVVELISEDAYEIDVNVPEVDIGKMKAGNAVNITLDALPGENFSGKVFFIDPAETVIDGAINFKTKISFNKADSRIKSGFTANLSIITQTKENALILPQFAILQNDSGIFVKKEVNKVLKDFPITAGITSKNGFVEILSGVREGEKVANIGLKTGS